MNLNQKRIKKTVLTIALTLVLAPFAAVTQEQAGDRKPSSILRPEQAGILLSEGRINLEQPHKTLNFMGLQDGDLVADIGCGNGYYSLRVAERIGPHGAVFAVDVQQGMLDQLEARRKEAGIDNIYPILGSYSSINMFLVYHLLVIKFFHYRLRSPLV